MSAIKLTDSGDIDITGGTITLIDGKEAVRQHLTVRLNFFLGEWKYDQSLGVPWYSDILRKNPSFVVVNQILKNVILSTPGVTELISFSFNLATDTRVGTLEFKALVSDEVLDFTIPVEA